MTFFEVLTIIGVLLALGTAVDFLVKDELRGRLSTAIRAFEQKSAPVGYSLAARLDNWLGSLFSLKSVGFYVAMSLLSLTISYWFAYITTEEDLVSIFFGSPSATSVFIFLIALVGCLVGDVFSYAQSRFFLRNIDERKSATVSAGFAISDVILSLSIFIGIFTLTRFIAYMVALSTSTVSIERQQQVNSALAEHSIEQLVEDGFAREHELAWASYLSKVRSPESASVVDEIARGYDSKILGLESDQREFRQEVQFDCSSDRFAVALANQQTALVLAREIAMHRGVDLGGNEFQNIVDDVVKTFEGYAPEDSEECAYPVFTITQKISQSDIIALAGYQNTLWASFERTLYDFYSNFGFKMATYAYFDPREDLPAFYQSLIIQSQFGFLGVPVGDYQAARLLGEFRVELEGKQEKVQIPFSPMLASALAVSALFWAYLLTIYFSRLAVWVANSIGALTVKFDIERGPAVSLALALSVVLVVLWLVQAAINFLWLSAF